MDTQKSRWGIPQFWTIAVLVAALVSSFAFSKWVVGEKPLDSGQSDSRSGTSEMAVALVVVDTKALFSAQIKKMLGREDALAAGQEGDRFAARLEEILSMYAQSGYLVVPRDATLATPPGLDVTSTVAQALGLSLDEDPQGAKRGERGG